ncbi:glycosyltransferase family 2 protein, partial [Rubrivirga sp.]|uniref:glycosyltransferase family 2 protein n=1 Tax=Rubrivirga sp. TaxID=1885344 RepID=UPI003C7233EA
MRTVVVIPARDEEASVGDVVASVLEAPSAGSGQAVETVVVVDNGSRDRTAEVAREAGGIVVPEPRAGYGRACLAGLAWVRDLEAVPDVVLFLDADKSDDPADLEAVLAPVRDGTADMVIGSRVLGQRAGRVEA